MQRITRIAFSPVLTIMESVVSSYILYARGWLNYYGIASMKNNIEDINGWLYHRIRMCIWKQWKKPRTKVRNLIKMGVPKELAIQAGNTRRGHWFATHTVAVNMAMTKERLINSGFYDLAAEIGRASCRERV